MFVKICGITTPSIMPLLSQCRVNAFGLVFVDTSPRYVEIGRAREIAAEASPGLLKVGLFANPDPAALAGIIDEIQLDMIQLHGTETPEQAAEIASLSGLPVIKAVAVSRAKDIENTKLYEGIADWLLFDAAPPANAKRTGGHGAVFNWSLLQNATPSLPWMLAGGLTPENITEAVQKTGAKAVDVSSGVEASPGVKDQDRIRAFVENARNPDRTSQRKTRIAGELHSS